MFLQRDFEELKRMIDRRYTFTDMEYDKMSDAAVDRIEGIVLNACQIIDQVEALALEYGLLLNTAEIQNANPKS